jgi:hypothetical protein
MRMKTDWQDSLRYSFSRPVSNRWTILLRRLVAGSAG